MGSVRETWEKLETSGELGEGYVRLRLSTPNQPALYAAKRVSDGLEALILEVRTTSLPPRPGYPRSSGFVLVAEPLTPGRAGRTRLLLRLSDLQFRDVFVALSEDIVPRLLGEDGETACVSTLISRLERWQAFLRKHALGGLSLEERRGLFGELWFLKSQLTPKLGPSAAVHAWKGPGGGNQDFELSLGSVEVKTTAANTPHSFHVNNVRQLDARGLPELFVYLLLLDESEAAQMSLPELIGEIRDCLSPAVRQQFDDNLVDMGFLDSQADLYDAPLYTVRRERIFRVAPGFPRLLEADLPEGIETVRYSVAIAACVPFEYTATEMWQALSSPDSE